MKNTFTKKKKKQAHKHKKQSKITIYATLKKLQSLFKIKYKCNSRKLKGHSTHLHEAFHC